MPKITSRPSSPMSTTFTRPFLTRNSESPGSSSKRMTLPLGYDRSRVMSAKRESSAGSSPLKSGTEARKPDVSTESVGGSARADGERGHELVDRDRARPGIEASELAADRRVERERSGEPRQS